MVKELTSDVIIDNDFVIGSSSHICELIHSILKEELSLLKRFGVDHLGYRYFLENGKSFGCPTVNNWYTTKRNKEFYSSMKFYLTKELLQFVDAGQSYVTRSASHSPNKYLDYLKYLSLCSSVGIYKRAKKRIDSFFFISNSDFGEARDKMINNIKYLESHVNVLSLKMDQIFLDQNINSVADLYIDEEVCYHIFNQNLHHNPKLINVIYNGILINLTCREIDVLKEMRLGNTNKEIASNLKISIKTLEKHINKIKSKFRVTCKTKLMKISQEVQFKYVRQYEQKK